MDTDILDNILSLEEQFYKEGHDLGAIDGARAGYTEGSVFAVEKSFEKLLQLGRLYGRALVWNQRLLISGVSEKQVPPKVGDEEEDAINTDIVTSMAPLHQGSRLAKNIQTLLALVDPATLGLQNTEDAVSDVEERLKGAALKVKLIQRALGEGSFGDGSAGDAVLGEGRSGGDGSGSIEDISSLHVRH